MGTNYYQHAIVGIEVSRKEITVIESPAVYEKQNRYDSKTGIPVRTENVLVKDEVSYLMFMGTRYEEMYDIGYDKKYTDLTFEYSEENDSFYLGVDFGETIDLGRVSLLDGEVSISELQDSAELVRKYFPDLEIKLYFFSSVG